MRILLSDLPTGGIGVYELNDQLEFEQKGLFGSMGRQRYVQKFCGFSKNGKRYLLVGRKGLTIQIYDIEKNYECVSTKQLMTNQDDSDFFVSLNVTNDEFRASTGLGYCYFLSLNSLMNSCFNDFSMSFGLQGSISFFKFLPDSENTLVIIGGKDREISIVDVESHLTIWKSKTPKKLDKSYQPYINKEKEAIWIQDVAIVKETETEVKFIAATRFGKLLIYNTQVSRLPIDEIEVSETPIKHIQLIDDLLFIADSFDNVTIFDYENQKILNKFQMKTGALCSMSFIELRSGRSGNVSSDRRSNKSYLLFVTSYIDKCLRLYKIEDGYKTLISGIHLGAGSSPEIHILETDEILDILEQDILQNKRLRSS